MSSFRKKTIATSALSYLGSLVGTLFWVAFFPPLDLKRQTVSPHKSDVIYCISASVWIDHTIPKGWYKIMSPFHLQYDPVYSPLLISYRADFTTHNWDLSIWETEMTDDSDCVLCDVYGCSIRLWLLRETVLFIEPYFVELTISCIQHLF